MTQITGVRKLKHTNSFTGQVPKYGVETPHKEELGKVGCCIAYFFFGFIFLFGIYSNVN